jgi:hypothetical protein
VFPAVLDAPRWAVRAHPPAGRQPDRARRLAGSVDRWFLLIGAVAVRPGVATALRYFFVTKLGERVVADLRKATYATS